MEVISRRPSILSSVERKEFTGRKELMKVHIARLMVLGFTVTVYSDMETL